MKKDKIVIIDGSSYFYRAFFAIRQLSNSKGFPTNAIFGFINMLLRVMEVEKPTKLGIAFDTPKPTFRKKLYPEYKANRQSPPEDLVIQIPKILEAVDHFGIYRMQKEGFEADDVIATMAKRARSEGYEVEIISGDKDLMQLVGTGVTLFDTMKEKRYNEKAVEEKFGVRPDQMVDFLALMGDSSDNIPGVKGIGKKTAAELLQAYDSLDGIYENLDEIKQKKRREILAEEKDLAYLSQKLVTLRNDLDIELGWQTLDYQGPNLEALQPFLEEMEFQNLLKKFGLQHSAQKFSRGKCLAIVDEDQLESIVDELQKSDIIAIDTETTSLEPHEAELVGISLSGKVGQAYYIPVGHRVEGELAAEQLSADVVRKQLKPMLENPACKKVGQNIKYDLQILRKFGLELKGIVADTMLASYVLDPEQPHGLDALSFRKLGHQTISYEEVAGKGKNQVSFSEVAIFKATEYAAEDAEVTLALNQHLGEEISKEKLEKVYEEVEVPLLKVLADMEYTGVSVDKKRLEAMSVELTEEIEQVEQGIYEVAGEEFNINSPKQLAKILFEKLKLPTVRKTKTGFSTDERVLRQLSSEHEIAKWIVRFRELVKLKSTYVEGLLSRIQPSTGRIHTHFNQTIAATGRLSSSNPNLQNIPVPKDGRYDIRSVFIPEKDWELFSADYSQVELRLLAHFSEDPELLKAFRNDEDVHEHTARLIFNVKDVEKSQRNVAKTINFGVVYGQTPYGLSQQLQISTSEAKAFIDGYFARYSGVKGYLNSLIEEARANGFVQTLLGRRRYVREIDSKNRMRREMAERTAINSPLQGTAADLIKLAMISIHQKMKEKELESRMLLQVHDELVFEAPEKEKKTLEALAREEMESALSLKVPLKVEGGWAAKWSKA